VRRKRSSRADPLSLSLSLSESLQSLASLRRHFVVLQTSLQLLAAVDGTFMLSPYLEPSGASGFVGRSRGRPAVSLLAFRYLALRSD